MNIQKKQAVAVTFAFASALLCLSGCNWFSKKDKESSMSNVNNDDVLLIVDGKPALTVQEYEEQLDAARQANPQLDMLLQMMPNAEKDFIFKGLATGKLIKAWGEKQGLDKDPKFQKAQKQAHEAMDLNLYMKHFEEAHPINISDSELKEYYEAKKDTLPGLMTAQGGVSVEYVRFDSKGKADAFLEKVKEVKTAQAFKEAATKDKLTAATNLVNEKSQLSDHLKHGILDIKKFPSVHVIKTGVDDGGFWVVFATGKTEAKYHDLNTPGVKEGLKKYMTDERKEKQLEGLVDNLKKELSVQENHSYFEAKDKKKQEAMAAAAGDVKDAGDKDEADDADMNNSATTVKV